MTFIIAFLLLLLLSSSSNAAPPKDFAKLDEMRKRYHNTKNGVIRLTDQDAEELIFAEDLPYTLLLLFVTEEGSKYPCRGCQAELDVLNEWSMSYRRWNKTMTASKFLKDTYFRKGLHDKVSKVDSILERFVGKEHIVVREVMKKYKTYKRNVFPVVMYFKDSYDTFRTLGARNVPEWYFIVPTKRNKKIEEMMETPQRMSEVVHTHTKLKIPIVTLPKKKLPYSIVVAILLAFFAPTPSSLKKLLSILLCRWTFMVVCFLAFGSSVAGAVFCILRSPGWYNWNHGKNGVDYVMPGQRSQGVLEGLIFAALNFAVATIIVLLYKVSGSATVASSNPDKTKKMDGLEVESGKDETLFQFLLSFLFPSVEQKKEMSEGLAWTWYGRPAYEFQKGEEESSSENSIFKPTRRRSPRVGSCIWLQYCITLLLTGALFTLLYELSNMYSSKVSWYNAEKIFYSMKDVETFYLLILKTLKSKLW
eukprot:g1380.t1